MEIIVDAYGPEEQALGWYYYLEGTLQFPFTAHCIARRAISPLIRHLRSWRPISWIWRGNLAPEAVIRTLRKETQPSES